MSALALLLCNISKFCCVVTLLYITKETRFKILSLATVYDLHTCVITNLMHSMCHTLTYRKHVVEFLENLECTSVLH